MQGVSLGAGLGALGFWSFIAAVVVAGIWYGIRQRQAEHETLRRMMESGQPIDQALMDRILSLSGGGRDRLDRDLQVAGLIVLSVAPGLALMGWVLGMQSEKALLPLLGAAALVGCVGIGLLVASRVVGRSRREEHSSAPTKPMA